MRRFLLYLFILGSIFASCTDSRTRVGEAGGDTIALKYARHLTIVKYDGYTQVNLVDPWNKGKILHTYYLVPKGQKGNEIARHFKAHLSSGFSEATSVVRTPVSRSIIFTTVHASLLSELGAGKDISGVCDLKYMNIPWIHRAVKAGKIVDCGDGMNANIEKIIETKPEVMLISPFENSGGYGKLDKVDIPIIETADYMETSALGRAEWMKFYGMLFDKEEKANRLFEQVDRSYQNLKAEALNTKTHPSVITELKTGSVWYVPGGRSVISQMIEDAGGKYVFQSDKNQGSLSYSFEKVLDEAGDADFWFYKYDSHPSTLKEIYADFQGYGEMKAWKTHHVYGCNTSAVPYYETASFHPERVLRDFIIILHPDLKLGKLKFYRATE